MANFAFFTNGELSAMEADKLSKLKEVFPKFFNKGEAVTLRANAGHFHTVKAGASANRMKTVKRPNAPVSTIMQAREVGADRKINTITISSLAPTRNPLTNKNNFGKHCYFSVGHNVKVDDENVLYFLYFHSNLIANGATENPRAIFSFVMEEQESKAKYTNDLANAEFMVKVSRLDDAAVNELLRKHNFGITDIPETNRTGLINLFKGGSKEVQENLNLFVDAILSDGETKNELQGEDIQKVVEDAIEAGRLKIESDSVYLLKAGTTEFSTRAAFKLSTEGVEKQLLEIIDWFTDNGDKLKFIK